MTKKGDYTVNDVFDICATYMNDEHLAFIKKAYTFAEKAHAGVKRKSGEPYITHPIQVAGILADLHMDPSTVATGFLHDVVEDTDYTYEDMVREFSQTVADLIEGVTKISKVHYHSKEEQKADNHRKMLLAMANDLRIIIVKLVDRLHNMRTMEYQTPEKQVQKSEETLEIYAPLAHRLGMSRIKWELEDRSLRYLAPDKYYDIVALMKTRREERESLIQAAIADIQAAIADMAIDAKIYGRPKHIYSIYHKMEKKQKEFNEIYDLLAVRILVDSIKDCYAVLGAVHTKWKPMPRRFKDYIAVPKENMYQSLHTTVIGPQGVPLEIQIRTFEMNRIAENGVAAHWAYKEGASVKNNAVQNHLNWFRDLLELQKDSANASEFVKSVKEDIFKDRVYVFTPKGDVTELTAGSGPLDFAYSVHTELGNKTVGATVNGRNVGLDHKLQNGDIIEIRTSNTAKPSPDWMKLVVTTRARNKIKRYFKLQERDNSIIRGKEALEKAITDLKFDVKEFLTKQKMQDICDKFNSSSEEDLYASIGFGENSPLTVANRLTEKERRQRELEIEEQKIFAEPEKTDTSQKMKIRDENGLIVAGGNNLLIRLSRCCRPVPGDDVVGYITKGHGISVHREDCPNVQLTGDEKNRLIEVEWDLNDVKKTSDYDTEIVITGYDRPNLLSDVINVANSVVKRLYNVNAKINDEKIVTLSIRVGIKDLSELDKLLEKLKMLTDVYTVHRVIS